MVNDQNTQKGLRSLLLITIVIIVISVAMVLLYLSARQASFAKTQPYNVSIQVESASAGALRVDYDYGYGFNAGHQQVFDIKNVDLQTVNFTISAWKELKLLRLTSDRELSVNSVLIIQKGHEYQALDSVVIASQASPLLISDINNQL